VRLSDLHTTTAASAQWTDAGTDPDITAVTIDSRKAVPGSLFVALKGAKHDGHDYLLAAEKTGCSAVLVSDTEKSQELSIPVLVHPSPRKLIGPIAAKLQNDPSESIAVVGITGTNGKTTTVEILAAVERAQGQQVGTLGTLGAQIGEKKLSTGFTTPEAPELQQLLATIRDDGCSRALMEVSSHGIASHRIDGVSFRVGAFTNLSQDHLDFHGTMEAYAESKARLFLEHLPASKDCNGAVINIDDPFGEDLVQRLKSTNVEVFPVSRKGHPGARGTVENVTMDTHGVSGSLCLDDRQIEFTTPLLGDHNLENILVAAGCAALLGTDDSAIAAGLASIPSVRGRLEPLINDKGVHVIVDYAHTPQALERTLRTLRSISKNRVICVFGCGGDRDQAKRPHMGQAAASGADVVVVTSDNPRSEDPQAIASQIEAGILQADCPTYTEQTGGYLVELDRAQAIRKAIALARTDDVVLIAGKGHEETQVIGDQVRVFSDHTVAQSILDELGSSAPGGDTP